MYRYPSAGRRRGSSIGGRLIFAAIIAIMSLVSYFGSRQDNPVTGETQYIGITVDEFWAIVDKGVNRNLFRKDESGQWVPTFEVGKYEEEYSNY